MHRSKKISWQLLGLIALLCSFVFCSAAYAEKQNQEKKAVKCEQKEEKKAVHAEQKEETKAIRCEQKEEKKAVKAEQKDN